MAGSKFRPVLAKEGGKVVLVERVAAGFINNSHLL
jgi:hypothetical protein